MLTTFILTLVMCLLLFLMICSAAYFLPWKGLMDFFPEDIKEKAIDHKPPFKTAPAFGWICMILCLLGFIGAIVYGGWDGIIPSARNGESRLISARNTALPNVGV